MENVDFHNFLDRMRNPAAADLVRSIKGFIINFTSNPPNPEIDSNSVQEFMSSMEGMFKVHSLWAGATDEELDSAGEGLEKYLMTKLFSRAFAPLPEDAEHDQKISDKICLLQQFIRPEHLDIPPDFQNETSWLLAQKELQKINTYKAPRDKLVCILNCCRVINNLLLKVSMATNNNPPGADDFLPVLIYVTIKANPPQLHSNLLYIQRYRHQSRLVSEAAYFYTNLVSAESFIENLVAGSVSMDEKEFEKKMQAARAAVNGTNNHLTSEPVSTSVDSILTSQTSSKVQKGVSGVSALVGGESRLGESPPLKTIPSTVVMNNPETVDSAMSVTNLEAKGAFAVLDSDRTGRLAQDYPFLYASAGDLRVEDVESLLNAYKELVLRYCALCKAVEDMTSLKATLGDGEPQKDSAGMAIFNADGQRTQSSAQKEGSSDFSEGGLERRVYASKESESEVEKHSFENPLLPPKSDSGVLDGLTIHGVTDIIENRDAILEVEKKVYEEDLNKILDSDTLKEHPDGTISNDIGIEEREILMQDFQNDKLEGVVRNDVGMKEES